MLDGSPFVEYSPTKPRRDPFLVQRFTRHSFSFLDQDFGTKDVAPELYYKIVTRMSPVRRTVTDE